MLANITINQHPQFTFGLILCGLGSIGFDKCKLMCIHHFKYPTEYFHSPKKKYLSIYSSLLQNLCTFSFFLYLSIYLCSPGLSKDAEKQ